MAGATGIPTGTPTQITQGSPTKGGIGESTLRPDGTLKVTGEFAYSSDMWHEDMLWGHTLRCPYAHAEIRSDRHLRGTGDARRLRRHDLRRPARPR